MSGSNHMAPSPFSSASWKRSGAWICGARPEVRELDQPGVGNSPGRRATELRIVSQPLGNVGRRAVGAQRGAIQLPDQQQRRHADTTRTWAARRAAHAVVNCNVVV